ncbi:hypothetical protein AVEN_99783-1 [Araneus ventricosus]|uniref:Uncharacterized protein n=1 Tax=Araneus ventricosus TaxID=182803 RepID=A0A4Y2SAT5_ARAVE|nr:hypothetical protein AVEN_99783-1 [Araneus ventricosus]
MGPPRSGLFAPWILNRIPSAAGPQHWSRHGSNIPGRRTFRNFSSGVSHRSPKGGYSALTVGHINVTVSTYYQKRKQPPHKFQVSGPNGLGDSVMMSLW